MKKKKLKFAQWYSLQRVTHPRLVILAWICLINLGFFICAGNALSVLISDSYGISHGFWASIFYAITMVLDAGCIQFIVTGGISEVSSLLIVLCIFIVVFGMLFFSGAFIGFITNYISNFIETANSDKRKLHVSNHTVILNWNSRASEIINDLLYTGEKEKIIVLVNDGKEAVQLEIENRLAETRSQEYRLIAQQSNNNPISTWGKRLHYRLFGNNLTIIVREGDTFSEKQLLDICVDTAKAVIILNRDESAQVCQYASEDALLKKENGNPLTIKTLVLVAQITSDVNSADNQKIIVEVDDEWTLDLVNRIISQKEERGKHDGIYKCNIVPIPVNKVLGQLLSQFSIMPQLNMVYSELFSNQGAEFYSTPVEDQDDAGDDIIDYFQTHAHAIPLTAMMTHKHGMHRYYMADKSTDVTIETKVPDPVVDIHCNPDFWLPRRNILVLGHNSNIQFLMAGFNSFRNEWNPAKDGRDIINLSFVDDARALEKMNYYRNYNYVNQSHVVEAEIYEREKIYAAINAFIDDQDGDTAILILSDDAVSAEDLDAKALTYLIYVQDIISSRKAALNAVGLVDERIDVIVEILNPKNYDVVHSYSIDNVVISNRYISKMITQISEKDTLFDFYMDILTYDEANVSTYESKELYIKRVGDFFTEVPPTCTPAELIRAVYAEYKSFSADNTASVLGYITDVPCHDEHGNILENETEEKLHFFNGDQTDPTHLITLKEDDKLIVFSNH